MFGIKIKVKVFKVQVESCQGQCGTGQFDESLLPLPPPLDPLLCSLLLLTTPLLCLLRLALGPHLGNTGQLHLIFVITSPWKASKLLIIFFFLQF